MTPTPNPADELRFIITQAVNSVFGQNTSEWGKMADAVISAVLPIFERREAELRAEVEKLTAVDLRNAAHIDKLQFERDHFKQRFKWWLNEAKGIARDRAELMNAGERYPVVVSELRALLKQRIEGEGRCSKPGQRTDENQSAAELSAQLATLETLCARQREALEHIAGAAPGNFEDYALEALALTPATTRDRIAELEAENEKERQNSHDIMLANHRQIGVIQDLRAQLVEARADSRRLDWLEEQGRTGMTPDWDDNGFWFTRIKGEYRTENTLRSIIDTARKEGAEDPKR